MLTKRWMLQLMHSTTAGGRKCKSPNERRVCIRSRMLLKHVAMNSRRLKLDYSKIYSQAVADVQNFIDTFRYFADLSQAVNYRQVIAVKNHEAWVSRHPWGACGFIVPWNFPVSARWLGACSGFGSRQHLRSEACREHATVACICAG